VAAEEARLYEFLLPGYNQSCHLVEVVLAMVLRGPEGPFLVSDRKRLNAGKTVAGEQDATRRNLGNHIVVTYKALEYMRLAFEHRVIVRLGGKVYLAAQSHLPAFGIWLDLAACRHGGHLDSPAASEARYPHFVGISRQVNLARDARILRIVDGEIAAGPDDSGVRAEASCRGYLYARIGWQ